MKKHSPLSAIYSQYSASCTEVASWQIAAHFGNLEQEKLQQTKTSVLADWSHIGKISIRGQKAKSTVGKIYPNIEEVYNLHGKNTEDLLCLQLVQDEYLLLCKAGQEQLLLQKIADVPTVVVNQTGALACFALQGPRKSEVWERSTAMNMNEDAFAPGEVISTTVHKMRCTIYRTTNLDIIIHERAFSQSLFEALLDVGKDVGLTPSGIDVVPVAFS